MLNRDTTRLSSLSIFFYVDSVPMGPGHILGTESLGGSESAMIGLANALAALGHDVHVFASKLQGDGGLYNGVMWHSGGTLPSTLDVATPDVLISLRTTAPFQMRVQAGCRILWNQDMLTDITQVSGALAQVDMLAYVSQFHVQQWQEKHPEDFRMVPAFVTRNGYDPSLVPTWPVQRDPYKFCYISRPERGLDPLLQMWPRIKERIPEATLHICRYHSMYDGEGTQVQAIVDDFDRKVTRLRASMTKEVEKEDGSGKELLDLSGIIWHGNLGKPALYELLTSCTLMLYPGIYNFGETSCIAAIEAQACGCVLVGSHRGALPETLGPGAGILIEGDSTSEAYQDSFIEAVYTLTHPDERDTLLPPMREAGRQWVTPHYTFQRIAQDWSVMLQDFFRQRYQNNQLQVMRQLLHWDHHVAAQMVANDILDSHDPDQNDSREAQAAYLEAREAFEFCGRVIRQEEQTAEHYGQFAMDTEVEAATNQRFLRVIEAIRARVEPGNPIFVTDVACGNGSFMLALLRAIPEARITGLDYSQGVLDRAHAALEKAGFQYGHHYRTIQVNLADPSSWPASVQDAAIRPADVVWCGEFLEHTAEPHLVVDALESLAKPGGQCFLSTPHGPLTELLPYHMPLHRGHTHHFSLRDMTEMFGSKLNAVSEHLEMGKSPRNVLCGHWLVSWERPKDGPMRPATPINHWHTILTTRPFSRVVAGLIVKNAEDWLHKCLASIWPQVEHIVILDTGSADHTLEIAERFPNVTVRTLADANLAWPACGFHALRNYTLQVAQREFAADWFLWIDSDEHLEGGQFIHQYTETPGPYLGYIIRQHHLMLDFDRFDDKPCRLFRCGQGIQFYGFIHEQPETTKDKGVFPSLDLPFVNIVHYGYEVENTRRMKLKDRNFPMLKHALVQKGTDAPRDLDFVLYMRDLTTLAGYEGAHTRLTPRTQDMLLRAITIYDKRGYADLSHRYHPLAWPVYQLALKWLRLGMEVEWAFAAGVPKLAGRARSEGFRVRSIEEARRYLTARMEGYLSKLNGPSYNASPWVSARKPDVPAPATTDTNVIPIR